MDRNPIEQLKQLPQRPDVIWEGEIVLLPQPGWDAEPLDLPMVIVWANAINRMTCSFEFYTRSQTTPAQAWQDLLAFALESKHGGYRPGRIRVANTDLHAYLGERLSEADIELELCDYLPTIQPAVVALEEHLQGDALAPGPLTGDQVTVERMRSFADAAAAFHRAVPWRQLEEIDLVRIEAPEPPLGMGLVSVRGALGEGFGLGFYHIAEECWDTYGDADPAKESERPDFPDEFWALEFRLAMQLPYDDRRLWREHDLPLADGAAYPCLARNIGDDDMSRPDADRLAFVEGLLRAIAASTDEQIDAGRWTVEAATHDGPRRYTLTLADVLDPPDGAERERRGLLFDERVTEWITVQMQRAVADGRRDLVKRLEALVQAHLADPHHIECVYPGREPWEKAQDLCYQAFTAYGRRRLQLVREAIAVSPDCPDAYVMLSERASDPEEVLALMEQAVAAGERLFPPEQLMNPALSSLDRIPAMPYLRARLSLAHHLDHANRLEEALDHYRAAVRLDPEDSVNARFDYLETLLAFGHEQEAEEYLKWRDDREPGMLYLRALVAYRLHGDAPESRQRLEKAIRSDDGRYIDYLTAKQANPAMPDDPDDESGDLMAILTAMLVRGLSKGTPGATDWFGKGRQPAAPAPSRGRFKQRKRKRR